MGGPTGTGLTTAPFLARVPALALIDRRGDVVRETEAFRADLAPDDTDRLSIWDFLSADQRTQLGRVLEGRLLRAELELPASGGVVTAEAEAVLDGAVVRHALLTVSRPAPEGELRSGAEVLLEDPSLNDSPAIVWVKDLDGRYLRVNRRYRDSLGVDDAGIQGKTDADLPPAQVVGEPRTYGRGGRVEVTQLEYTVDRVGNRDALTVLRFPLHGLGGEPVAVCGVAASVSEAATARSEAERLLRVERWAGLSAAAIRAELIDEWELAELAPEPVVDSSADRTAEVARLRSELEAAQAGAAELEGKLASEQAARAALEARLEAEGARSEHAAARAEELVSEAESERLRLEELGTALEAQRRRADEAETQAAAALERTTELEARLAEEEARISELREAAAASARRVEHLASGAAGERDRLADLQATAAAQRERAEMSEQETAAAQERAAGAERDLAEERERATRAEQEMRAATDQAARAEREVAAARDATEAVRREVARERERADGAERHLAAAQERLDELERAKAETLAAADHESEAGHSARAEVERREAEAHRRATHAEQVMAAERAEAARVRDELLARAERAESLLAEVHAAGDPAAAAADRARADAELACERAQGLETALAEERLEHAASRAARDEAQAQTAGLRAALEQARAESADLHGAIAEGQAESSTLHEALDHARAEQSALAASVAQAKAETETARRAAREATEAARVASEAARAASEELERELRLPVADPVVPTAQAALTATPSPTPEPPGAHAEVPAPSTNAPAPAVNHPARPATPPSTGAYPVPAAPASPRPATHVGTSAANGNAWNPGPMPIASVPAPTWSLGAQRELTSSLASASAWRTGLKDALRILGTQGGWDVIITWCPDERTGVLRCVATWMLAQGYRNHFETDTWQRRESPSTQVGQVAGSDHAAWFGDLGVVDDPQLAAAAREGMKGALLVPLHHDGEGIGVLQLMSAGTGTPGPDVVSAIEAVGLQLAHFEQVLRQSAEPRWRVARL